MNEIFYHGSSQLFYHFNLAHALEGDGKVKFGYGVYVTSSYASAAHYAGKSCHTEHYYVYTVAVPTCDGENFIAFKQPVAHSIVEKASKKLGVIIPDKITLDGKDFRKYLAKHLNGKADLEGEKMAAAFLLSIGVDYIEWPYTWSKPDGDKNRAVLDDKAVKIIKIEEVELERKGTKNVVVTGSTKIIYEAQ